MKHYTYIVLFIISSILFTEKVVAQTCSNDFSVKTTVTQSICQADGSITVDLEGTTTGLYNIQYSLKSTAGLTVTPQNSNVFSNLPPGTYTVTVKAFCQTDPSYSKTEIKDNINVGGTYRAPTIRFAESIGRKAFDSCSTGQIAIGTTNGNSTYNFEITTAPSGVTLGPVTIQSVTGGIPGTATETYHLFSGQYPAGNYAVKVTDGCYSVTHTFTLNSFKAFPYLNGSTPISCKPLPYPSNTSCNIVAQQSVFTSSNSDLQRYINEGLFEMGVGLQGSMPTQWTDYKYANAIEGKDYLPLSLSPKTYVDLWSSTNYTTYIRLKDCPSQYTSVTISRSKNPNNILSFNNIALDCDGTMVETDLFASGEGFWCYPVQIKVYNKSTGVEYYNGTSDGKSTDYNFVRYKVPYNAIYILELTDQLGVTAKYQRAFVTKNPSLFYDDINRGCTSYTKRYKIAKDAPVNCFPITMKQYDTDNNTLVNSVEIKNATDYSDYLSFNFTTNYTLKFTIPSGQQIHEVDFKAYPKVKTTSFEIVKTQSGGCGFGKGFIVVRGVNSSGTQITQWEQGAKVTLTGPPGFTPISYVPKYANISAYFPEDALQTGGVSFPAGTYHMRLEECDGVITEGDIDMPGLYEKDTYRLEQELTCDGLEVTPKGSFSFFGENLSNTYTRIIAYPNDAAVDKNYHNTGQKFTLNKTGTYVFDSQAKNSTTGSCVYYRDTIYYERLPLVLDPKMTFAYVCQDGKSSVSIQAVNGVAPYTYEMWNEANTVKESVADIVTSGIAVFEYGQTDVTYTIRIKDKCGAAFSQKVTVKSLKDMRIAFAQPAHVCVGEDINLKSIDLGDVPYKWTGPNGFISTDKNPVIANATSEMQGVYTLEVDMSPLCGGITTDQVTVSVGCSIYVNPNIRVR